MTRADLTEHAVEVEQGERFQFGENWARFVRALSDDQIAQAKSSLLAMLGHESLVGMTFLDIGSGSGLFSLAARSLGARVHSFDYDPMSVTCTAELKRRYFPDDPNWVVESGSVLEPSYLSGLGQFDIVYSWNVLHHTGKMWQALANVAPLVRAGGQLFIAIYNDQGRASRMWRATKRCYNAVPSWLALFIAALVCIRLWLPTTFRDLVAGKPFRTWRTYARERGMSPWRDVIDWVGGYPFEVAKPDELFDFYYARGFRLERLKTCAGGFGCNELVFAKGNSPQHI